MNTVLVGLDPGGNGQVPLDPEYPSGRRLADLYGLSPEDYLERTDRVNLHPLPRPASEDDGAATCLAPLLRGRRVLALGGRVSRALGAGPDLTSWSLRGDSVIASLPHPSGRCRWWNDGTNAESARGFLRRSLRPCLHLEGTDGSGKTTLASWLAREGGYDLVDTEGPASSWEECLARVGRRLDPGSVCDRSSGLVSELVYGPVLRGGCLADEGDYWRLVRQVLHAVAFVYCRPPDGAVAPTFREGEDPTHVRGVVDNRARLLARYDEVMAKVSALGGRVVRYDWTRQSPEEVLSCVE